MIDRNLVLLALLSCLTFSFTTQADQTKNHSETSQTSRTVRIDGVGRAELHINNQGQTVFIVSPNGQPPRTMTPDQFAQYATEPTEHETREWIYHTLNISNPWGIAWVSLGLLGQAVFMGRMIVQWLSSERQGRSVIPVAFWWMSLIGATMLLVYFIWRRDIVGTLGQATGWFIYARNLSLIHRPKLYHETIKQRSEQRVPEP